MHLFRWNILKYKFTVAVGIPESSEATRRPLLRVVTFVSGTLTSVCSNVAACVDCFRPLSTLAI